MLLYAEILTLKINNFLGFPTKRRNETRKTYCPRLWIEVRPTALLRYHDIRAGH